MTSKKGKMVESGPVRVVVADDSVLLREGIVRLLEDADFEVVGQAGDAEDLVRKVAAHKPDVAVVDIRMPPTQSDDGLRAALEIGAATAADGRAGPLSTWRRGTRSSSSPTAPRAPATCSRPRRRGGGRFVDAVRRWARGLGAGPGGRRAPARAPTPRRSARAAHRARAGGLGADGGGRSNHAIADQLCRDRARRREARHEHLRQAEPRAGGENHRRVLAVLTFLRA